MKRKKITITKLTVVELITQSEDSVFILYISAYQFFNKLDTQRTIQSFLFHPSYTVRRTLQYNRGGYTFIMSSAL